MTGQEFPQAIETVNAADVARDVERARGALDALLRDPALPPLDRRI